MICSGNDANAHQARHRPQGWIGRWFFCLMMVLICQHGVQAANQVSLPSVFPPAGSYPLPILVSACDTSWAPGQGFATVRFTTDGSEPTDTSEQFTGVVLVTDSTVFKVRSFRAGQQPSGIVTVAYQITFPFVTKRPQFDPPGGTYLHPITVALSSASAHATIRFTTDGSQPGAGSSRYLAPIPVTDGMIIRAYADAPLLFASGTASARYALRVGKPTLNPPGGSFAAPQVVAITSETPSAELRYTIDGTAPSVTSPLYSQAITISQTATVRVMGFRNGFQPSEETSAQFVIQGAAEPPTFNPPGGTFANDITVSILPPASGGEIRYTADGSDVTATSPLVQGPLLVGSGLVLKARTYRQGVDPSITVSAAYAFKVANPQMSPDGVQGQSNPVSVSLASSTTGASLRFTLDGSDPTIASPEFTQAIVIESTALLSVRGFKTGYAPSDIVRRTFEVLPIVEFSSVRVAFRENIGAIDLPVVLNRASPAPARVGYRLKPIAGAGENGIDYRVDDGELIIPAGGTQGAVSALLIDNSRFQLPRRFAIELITPVGAVLGAKREITVDIIDDDALPSVQFSLADQGGFAEGDHVDVEIRSVGATDLPIVIPIHGESLSATPGVDYTMDQASVTIPPGTSVVSIGLQVVVDALVEPDEVIRLQLGTPINAMVGDRRETTATIRGQRSVPVALSWNREARKVIAKYRLDPPIASRLLAALSVAQHRAAVLTSGLPAGSGTSVAGAVSAASVRVLSNAFPSETSAWESLAGQLVAQPTWSGFSNEVVVGAENPGTGVASAVITLMSTDGASSPHERVFSAVAGQWSGTAPLRVGWGLVRPWFMASGSQFRPTTPPQFGGAEFQQQLAEVELLATQRTPAQVDVARTWSDWTGTRTAPGHWNEIADDAIIAGGRSEQDAAHILAVMNAALMDAGIATWDSAFAYRQIRPYQVSPGLLTLQPHQELPSYVSSHACFAGAARAVLAQFLPDHQTQLDVAEADATQSGLYAGIHLRADIERGQAMGRAIGELALAQDVAGDWLRADAPTIQILSPELGSRPVSGSLGLTAAISGVGQLADGQVSFRLIDADSQAVIPLGPSTIAAGSLGSWTAQVAPVGDLPDGNYLLSVTVGYGSGKSLTAQSAFTVDTMGSPTITVTSPTSGLVVGPAAPITLVGEIDQPITRLTVNGVEATFTVAGSHSTFSVPLSIAENPAGVTGTTLGSGVNDIRVVAWNRIGTRAVAITRVVVDRTPPVVTIESPTDAQRTTATSVLIIGKVFDQEAQNGIGAQPLVQVNNQAPLLQHGTFRIQVPLNVGSNVITAHASDGAGNVNEHAITIERMLPTGVTITAVSGDDQSATVGQKLANPVVVRVTDAEGVPLPRRAVQFTVQRGDAALPAARAPPFRSALVLTDDSGVASVGVLMGMGAGSVSVTIRATTPGALSPVEFVASSVAGGAVRLGSLTREPMRGVIGQRMEDPFIVMVSDEAGNGVTGVPVRFAIADQSGLFSANGDDSWAPTIEVVSDASGRAQAWVTLDGTSDQASRTIEISTPTLTASPLPLLVQALTAGPDADTAISGRVFDDGGAPLLGAQVTIDGVDLTGVTDQTGFFHVRGVPPGLAKITISASAQSNAERVYVPTKMTLRVLAGIDNALGSPCFLPTVAVAGLVTVGGDQDVTLSMPSMPTYQVTISAHSTIHPDGTRAPVAMALKAVADYMGPVAPPNGRLPMMSTMLYPTDIRFDPPPRIQIPNVVGQRAGSRVPFTGYHAGLGTFETLGWGRVSSDGASIELEGVPVPESNPASSPLARVASTPGVVASSSSKVKVGKAQTKEGATAEAKNNKGGASGTGTASARSLSTDPVTNLIIAVSNSNPCIITVLNHGLGQSGQSGRVSLDSTSDRSSNNGPKFAVVDQDHLALTEIDTRSDPLRVEGRYIHLVQPPRIRSYWGPPSEETPIWGTDFMSAAMTVIKGTRPQRATYISTIQGPQSVVLGGVYDFVGSSTPGSVVHFEGTLLDDPQTIAVQDQNGTSTASLRFLSLRSYDLSVPPIPNEGTLATVIAKRLTVSVIPPVAVPARAIFGSRQTVTITNFIVAPENFSADVGDYVRFFGPGYGDRRSQSASEYQTFKDIPALRADKIAILAQRLVENGIELDLEIGSAVQPGPYDLELSPGPLPPLVAPSRLRQAFIIGGRIGTDQAIDIDVDSNNDNALTLPTRDVAEEQIEDDLSRLGKVLVTNRGFTNDDEIPDYFDGFRTEVFDHAVPNASRPFTPLIIEIGQTIDVNQARIRIVYDASDPLAVVQATGDDGEPTFTLPDNGVARLWLKDGPVARDGHARAGVAGMGDYLPPGTYTAAELGMTADNRAVTLFIEGIRPSRDDQDTLVQVTLEGVATPLSTTDTVHLSIIDYNADLIELTQTEMKKVTNVVGLVGLGGRQSRITELVSSWTISTDVEPAMFLLDHDWATWTRLERTLDRTAYKFPLSLNLAVVGGQLPLPTDGGIASERVYLQYRVNAANVAAISDRPIVGTVVLSAPDMGIEADLATPFYARPPFGSANLLGNRGTLRIRTQASNLGNFPFTWTQEPAQGGAVSDLGVISAQPGLIERAIAGTDVGATIYQVSGMIDNAPVLLLEIPVIIPAMAMLEPQPHQLVCAQNNAAKAKAMAADGVDRPYDQAPDAVLDADHLRYPTAATRSRELQETMAQACLFRAAQILPRFTAGTNAAWSEPFTRPGGAARFAEDTAEEAWGPSLPQVIRIITEGAMDNPVAFADVLESAGAPPLNLWQRYAKCYASPDQPAPLLRIGIGTLTPAMIDLEFRAKQCLEQAALARLKKYFSLTLEPETLIDVAATQAEGYPARLLEFNSVDVATWAQEDQYDQPLTVHLLATETWQGNPAIKLRRDGWEAFKAAFNVTSPLELLFDTPITPKWSIGHGFTEDVLQHMIQERYEGVIAVLKEIHRQAPVVDSPSWPFRAQFTYATGNVFRPLPQTDPLASLPLVVDNTASYGLTIAPNAKGINLASLSLDSTQSVIDQRWAATSFLGSDHFTLRNPGNNDPDSPWYGVGEVLHYQVSASAEGHVHPQDQLDLLAWTALLAMDEIHLLQQMIGERQVAAFWQNYREGHILSFTAFTIGDFLFGLGDATKAIQGVDFVTGAPLSMTERSMSLGLAVLSVVDPVVVTKVAHKVISSSVKASRGLRAGAGKAIPPGPLRQSVVRTSEDALDVTRNAPTTRRAANPDGTPRLSDQPTAAGQADQVYTSAALDAERSHAVAVGQHRFNNKVAAQTGTRPAPSRLGVADDVATPQAIKPGDLAAARDPLVKMVDGRLVPLSKLKQIEIDLYHEGGEELVQQFQRVACFPAGTPVVMADGSTKPIEQIAVGDRVRSRSEYSPTAPVRAQTVVKTMARMAPSLHVLRFVRAGNQRHGDRGDGAGDGDDASVGEVRCTAEHPLWVMGRGWTPAERVADGDVVRGEEEDLRCVGNLASPGSAMVLNLMIDDSHTYFVGTKGEESRAVWVHNECAWEAWEKAVKGNDDIIRIALGLAEGAPLKESHRLDAFKIFMDSKKAEALIKSGNPVWVQNTSMRGSYIEALLGGNLEHWFPVIDKWDFTKGIATSIKSLDSQAKSYVEQKAVCDLVSRYVTKASNFVGVQRKKTITGEIISISEGQILERELILAVRIEDKVRITTWLSEIIKSAARNPSPFGDFPVTLKIVGVP